jgi:hypothetical protein
VLLWGLPHRGNPTITLSLDDFLKEAITARLGPVRGSGEPDRQASPRRGGARIRSRRGLEAACLRSCPEREMHRYRTGGIAQSAVGAQSD